jgi:hypothetical protein
MGWQLQLDTSTAIDFNRKQNIIKTQKKGKLLQKKSRIEREIQLALQQLIQRSQGPLIGYASRH